MATDSLWIRLNIDWDRAKWIRHLPRSTRSLWPDLLRWVKMNSPVKGFVKYTGDVSDLADDLRLDIEDVPRLEELIRAAADGGAIVLFDDVLKIVQWDEYQDPETIRKRRAKAEIDSKNRDSRKTAEIPDISETSNNSAPIRKARKVAESSGRSAKTETETETETVLSPKSPEGTETKFSSFAAFFAEFKSRYPARKGGQEWPTASDRLSKVWKTQGAAILEGADRYRKSVETLGKLGTEYVKMASTWVGRRGWLDDGLDEEQSKAVVDDSPQENRDFFINGEGQKIDLLTGREFDESAWRSGRAA